jgi:hypothetical protein
MIVFASALKFHAENAGKLGRPIVGDSHARNARVIADIPYNRIEKISYAEIVDLGFV